MHGLFPCIMHPPLQNIPTRNQETKILILHITGFFGNENKRLFVVILTIYQFPTDIPEPSITSLTNLNTVAPIFI